MAASVDGNGHLSHKLPASPKFSRNTSKWLNKERAYVTSTFVKKCQHGFSKLFIIVWSLCSQECFANARQKNHVFSLSMFIDSVFFHFLYLQSIKYTNFKLLIAQTCKWPRRLFSALLKLFFRRATFMCNGEKTFFSYVTVCGAMIFLPPIFNVIFLASPFPLNVWY